MNDICVKKNRLNQIRIKKTKVDLKGIVNVYLASDVLASTPTAVHTIRRVIFQRKRTTSKTA